VNEVIDQNPPRDALELRLQRIWEELLKQSPIGVDADFFSIGGDSMTALALMARVVQETGYQLPAAGIVQASTIAKLAVALRTASPRDRNDPIVPLHAASDLPRFYCVHPVGGSALCYLRLARELQDSVAFFGVQSPTIESNAPPVCKIDEMADDYVAAIRKVQPHGPYLLGGWSYGGIIAYEIARKLKAAGEPIGLLALIDSGQVYSFAVLLTMLRGHGVDLLSRLSAPSAEQLELFRVQTEPAKLVPAGADDAMARRIYENLIACMRGLLDFHLKPYDGEAVLFRAREPYVRKRRDPEEEWRELCSTLTVVPTGGNHLTVIHEPNVQELASHIRDALVERGFSAKPRA